MFHLLSDGLHFGFHPFIQLISFMTAFTRKDMKLSGFCDFINGVKPFILALDA
jgi:hypothetical protein